MMTLRGGSSEAPASVDAIPVTTEIMPVTFRPEKNAINRRKHGFDLSEADRFDWDSATIDEDTSEAYGEQRFLALGFIGITLCALVFTMEPDGETVRAISLRKASKPEQKRWSRP